MKFLVATLSLFFAASLAHAQTITFDPPPEGPLIGNFVRIGGYVEDGIVFQADPDPGSIIVEDAGGVPSNGTAFLSKCGICAPSMHSEDGGLFDLVSIDLGELLFFGFGPFATAATITGTKDDGSTVVANITTDGLVGFETFALDDSFRDLVSVQFSTLSPYANLAIDNIEVVVGLAKPIFSVSPPSGTYVTSQDFDITLVVVGPAASAAILAAILNGVDFTSALQACVIAGSLESTPGATLRCPAGSALLDAGMQTLEVTLDLGAGMTVTDTATWEILRSSEP